MSKSIIIGVIILMSISLLGVVGLQLYWITDAIKVKEEQFDRSVHEALQTVVSKLETQEAVAVVTGQMANLNLPSDAAMPAIPAPPPPMPAAPYRPQNRGLNAEKHTEQAPTAKPLKEAAPPAPAKSISLTEATPAREQRHVISSSDGHSSRLHDSILIINGTPVKRSRKVIIRNPTELIQSPSIKIVAPDAQAIDLLQNQTVFRIARADTLLRQLRGPGGRLTFSADTLLHMVKRLDSVRFVRRVDPKTVTHLSPTEINSIMVKNDTIFIYERSASASSVQRSAGSEVAIGSKPLTRTRPAQDVRTQTTYSAIPPATTAPATTAAAAAPKAQAAAKKEQEVNKIKDSDFSQPVRVEVHKVEAKKDKLNDVVKQMVEEYMVKEKPLQERLNLQELHNLLRTELEDKGIKLDFGYWVVSGLNDTIATRTTQTAGILPAADYRVSLFPHDIFEKPDYLAVYFPESKAYALKSLWLMLILSCAFTLVILLTFGSTIYIIFRQKKLSEMKNDFINNMTHEFKTPIATISLATDSISNPKIFENPEKINYYNNIIREENKRMNAQVENVLQIALLEKNEFKMDLQPVDVHALILRAVERIKLQVEQRTGQITAQLNALHHEVLSDEVHLNNVICNLLDNANKYSPVSPDIKLVTQNVEGGLLIAVEDKGLGMSKDTQQRVFEKFYRVPTGNLHNVKGFGLGLSYVKAIVEAHRGNIRLKSEPGKGSRFEIFLPI